MNQRIAYLADLVKHVDLYPAPVATLFDPLDVCLPFPIRDAKRFSEYMQHQTIDVDPARRLVGSVRFDGSFRATLFGGEGHTFRQELSPLYLKVIDNLVTYDYEHSTLDIECLLTLGIEGLKRLIAASLKKYRGNREKEEFLTGCDIVCDGIIAWAERIADRYTAAAETAAADLPGIYRGIADICRRVPRHPAASFRDAVYSMALCYPFQPDSIGGCDRYLYRFYHKDIADGIITRDEAKELLQELFILMQGKTPCTSNHFDRGGECHFSIGGYTETLEDGWNELSELILESLLELPLYAPEISFRWTPKTPFDRLLHILECEKNDPYKRVALVNDEPRIDLFTKIMGMSTRMAVQYSMIGCNVTAFPGSLDLTGVSCNYAHALTSMLYRRTDELEQCRSFDEVYRLFTEELSKDLDTVIHYADLFNAVRARDINVLSTIFMEGCIKNGISITQGGGNNMTASMYGSGLICIIDSLALIEQLVFEEKRLGMKELMTALKADWKGYESLQCYILQRGRFFGNDDPLSDGMARRVTITMHELLKDKYNLFGVKIVAGCVDGYPPFSAWYGEASGATPDGRCAGEPFMIGVGQTRGKDRGDLTALIKSVGTMDPTHILAGAIVFNVNVDEALMSGANLEKTAWLIETYFKLGGVQIQLNYVSAAVLREARKNKNAYPDLRVRVSGFSAKFDNLDDELQVDIIKRTERKH